jgi:hypothetical protein
MSDGLLPVAPTSGTVRIDRELPSEARNWGRILDMHQLEAGDLMLFRLVEPDAVSRQIVRAQIRGGFNQRHAQWTHAAVYLGDGEHICEANWRIFGRSKSVVMRSAFCYCDGRYAIRARRPGNMDEKQRLRIAIGALTNLGKGYSKTEIFQFTVAAMTGRGFWETMNRGPRIRVGALVCSTLYQDAYNFAFKGNTVRMGSLCTPAHLSASADFEAEDRPLAWLAIE